MKLPWARRTADTTNAGGTAGSGDFDEAKAFVDHARWLVDYHNKRSDNFASKSVALLGFSGVILALFARTTLPNGAQVTLTAFILIVATTTLLLLTALMSLLTLFVTKVSAPSVDDLTRLWSDWAANSRRGKAHGDIAETYIRAKVPAESNPVKDAFDEADIRGRYFKGAAAAMLAAVAMLAALLILIAFQTTPWKEETAMGNVENTNNEVEDSQVFDLQDTNSDYFEKSDKQCETKEER